MKYIHYLYERTHFYRSEHFVELLYLLSTGLKKGYVNKPNAFIIDTKGAGPGELSLAVEGPSKADFECIDNGDGTCTATYIPKEPGNINVLFLVEDFKLFYFDFDYICICYP